MPNDLRWVLDARPVDGGVKLLLVSGTGSLEEEFLRTNYVAYLLPKAGVVTPEELARALEEHPEVLGAEVEEWLAPPWYDQEVEVVKALIKSLRGVKDVVRRASRLGLAEPVNTYPDPLTLALKQSNVNPCAAVGPDLRLAEDLSNPHYRPPPYRVVELYLTDWGGGPSMRPTHFTLRCWEGEFGGDLRDLSTYSDVLASAHILVYYGNLRAAAWEAPEVLSPPVKLNGETMLTGVHGLIEWCRMSWTPLRAVATSSIGKVLTTVEALEAFRRKWLVPDRVARTERFRRASDLLIADRGGLVLTPRPGVYFNVAQLDFNSLYPSLIVKHNVSPETVNRPDCRTTSKVPEVEHEICKDFVGLVPAALSTLIERRAALKAALKAGGDLGKDLREVLDERQAAIKWVLVASFGYLGYRNSRFGKIEAYESVTALAREALRTAKEVAEREGFRVLHAIVDSIFVSKKGCSEEHFEALAKKIGEAVGVSVKVEAIYDWIAYPPSRNGTGVPTKYFGRVKDGTLKVKGLEAVSDSAPLVLREAQLEALKTLAAASNKEEFFQALNRTLQEINKWIVKIREGAIPPHYLVITRKLRKKEYVSKQPHVKVAMKAKAKAGATVRYIVAAQPYPVETGYAGYSRNYYIEMLVRTKDVLLKLRRLMGD